MLQILPLQGNSSNGMDALPAAGNPYQDENGVFGDNQFRYALLSLAACEAPLQLNIGGFRCIWPSVFARFF